MAKQNDTAPPCILGTEVTRDTSPGHQVFKSVNQNDESKSNHILSTSCNTTQLHGNIYMIV